MRVNKADFYGRSNSRFHLCPFCVTVHKQEGHDGPASLHWLTCEIPSYQTLQYLGIGLKHNNLANKD